MKNNCPFLLSGENSLTTSAKLYRKWVIALILCSTFINAVGTVSTLPSHYNTPLHTMQISLFALLSLDFFIRFGCSIEKKKYFFSFFGFVDGSAVGLFIMALTTSPHNDLLVIGGMIPFLKFARYSPALIILKDVLVSEKKPLLSSLYLMAILTLTLSTLLYFLERHANPNGFGSIPQAMWWSVVTLATLGYGDVVPITVLGKIFGGMAAIMGFGMFALPAGILANGFAEEIKRLRDVASWNMVAKVPLFSNLESDIISEITSQLRVKRFIRNEVIIKEGDKGNAMYFILEGECEVQSGSWHTILGEGNFFGEISLLNDIPRTATVVAKTRCTLLELTAYDFKKSIASHPEILVKVEAVAHERYAFKG